MDDDIALDKVGRYGCLAVEAIYNCYNTTDPVAFKLAPTVDREYARMLRPIALSEAVPALLEALSLPRLSLSKYFEVVHPFSKAGDAAAMPDPERTAALYGARLGLDMKLDRTIAALGTRFLFFRTGGLVFEVKAVLSGVYLLKKKLLVWHSRSRYTRLTQIYRASRRVYSQGSPAGFHLCG